MISQTQQQVASGVTQQLCSRRGILPQSAVFDGPLAGMGCIFLLGFPMSVGETFPSFPLIGPAVGFAAMC